MVAGEVIEHLDDCGPFLDGLHVLVAPSGMLAVTTPNGAGLDERARLARNLEVNHPDHVVSFTSHTLDTMLRRHGWEPIEHAVFVYEVKTEADGTARPNAHERRTRRPGGRALLARSVGPTSRADWSSSPAPSQNDGGGPVLRRLGLVAVGAAAWRIWYILGPVQDRVRWPTLSDEWFYHRQAELLADGHGFANPFLLFTQHRYEPTAFHPPLYTVFLSLPAKLGFTTHIENRSPPRCSARSPSCSSASSAADRR